MRPTHNLHMEESGFQCVFSWRIGYLKIAFCWQIGGLDSGPDWKKKKSSTLTSEFFKIFKEQIKGLEKQGVTGRKQR